MPEKKLVIKVTETFNCTDGEVRAPIHPVLDEEDYPNVCLKHEITEKEFENAVDVLITYFAQTKCFEFNVDLNQREQAYKAGKEMTLEEIEKELGHNIRLVSRKEGE